jgi:hypothetical protein
VFRTGDAPTLDLSLDEVLNRLASHAAVDAILVMGSAGAEGEGVGPASDYDLLVVLRELSLPLRLVLTRVDHRLTEVYFTSAATLEQLVAGDRLQDGAEELRLAMTTWIQTGRIAFDRVGHLAQARTLLAGRASFLPATDAQLYDRWVHTNYNVRQTQRMVRAEEAVYQTAVDLRLLYGLDDLKVDYFAMRRLPYRGEKEAVRYWMERDPAYLQLFQATLAERDRAQKVALYSQLAAMTLVPVGGLIPENATSVTLEPDRHDTSGAIGEALRLWGALVADRHMT